MPEATVKLINVGLNKIGVIKAMREINTSLGLKEAKDFVESLPRAIVENVPESVADSIVQRFRDIGAEVEVVSLGGPAEAAIQVVGKNQDLNRLVEICFPDQPELAVKLQKYVDNFGLSLGWYVGLMHTGMVKTL